MTVRFDLRGSTAAGRLRRSRAFGELAALAAMLPEGGLQVDAAGDDAFSARLVVGPGVEVSGGESAAAPALVYRPYGEACPLPLAEAPTLAEPLDLGRLVDGEQGPDAEDRLLERGLLALAGAGQVTWRVAAQWQAEVLRDRLGVPSARIARLPSQARLPPVGRLGSIRLPSGLPARYLLCLTPVGDGGDHGALIAAHARLGAAAPPLVVLGVDDERWLPAVRMAVEEAGSRGRVLLLRDLDPVTEAAAIARAEAVVAIARHPAHALRLRRAAALGRPAVVRRHPGHCEWVTGGRWFAGSDELADALAVPAPVALRPPGRAAPASLAEWITGRRRGDQARRLAASSPNRAS